MPEIQSLCDALLKTGVQEDRCTNFLLWILRRLPSTYLQKVCQSAGLALNDISNEYGFNAQWILEKSRPDAVVQLAASKYLIIETKRFPNALNASQFENHITGSAKEFGPENCCFLFISGDRRE